MPGFLQEDIGIMMPQTRYAFARSQVAASLTNVNLKAMEVNTAAVGSNGVIGYPQLFGGWIVGYTIALSGTAGAGSLTIAPTINGTVVAGQTLAVTTAQYAAAPLDSAGAGLAFNANDRIGAQITTTGAWNGTTLDLIVDLFVVWADARF